MGKIAHKLGHAVGGKEFSNFCIEKRVDAKDEN